MSKQEWEQGTVAVAILNGKVRLLRYLPEDGSPNPWTMDPTYEKEDYVQSNWESLEDPRLSSVHLLSLRTEIAGIRVSDGGATR